MKVLLVGNGGRENAIAWRLRRSDSVREIVAPNGNPGIARFADVPAVALATNADWVRYAKEQKSDLVVIGPEAPLAAGLADALHAAGIPAFGPVAAGARLEASKSFSKDVMEAAGVPTARSRTVTRTDEAFDFARSLGLPVVIKADGLAAGKGVTVATTWTEAEAAIIENLVGARFGESSAKLVIEEFMPGEEASIFGLCDGETVFPLVAAQDHKRVFDNDEGPNTGGMGAYAPAPVATPAIVEATMQQVFLPTLAELNRRGIRYRGVLYAGLMVHAGAVRVVEFNCRFGDPETQVVMPLIEGDLGEILLACAEGRLGSLIARGGIGTAALHALTVVLASGGYPGNYNVGEPITGLEQFDQLENGIVFHAGTALGPDGQVVTAGGRVIACTAWDTSLARARTTAYNMVRGIQFAGKHFRSDIAFRAMVTRS
jgi:phosphoribosylamine--glycine ligase